jgi:predicted nucleic acid-binding protein
MGDKAIRKSGSMITLYFDVCCLNRPFDDQTQDRIHLEAEAVLLIIKHIESDEWRWLSSGVVNFEIQQTPNPDRRYEVQLLTRHAHQIVTVDETIIRQAEALKDLGFKTYDALHLACAEIGLVDVFLTTDESILKRASQYHSHFKISVRNPLEWLWEYVTT